MPSPLRSFLLLLFFSLAASPCLAQHKADSLTKRLQATLQDTDRLNTLNALSREIINTHPDSTAIAYSNEALKLGEKLKASALPAVSKCGEHGTGKAIKNLGVMNYFQGNYSQALILFLRALEIFEKTNDKAGIANVLGNIGVIYNILGDYSKALEYSFKGLKLEEASGNKSGILAKLSGIGLVYFQQQDYNKALEFYFKALKLAEELGDKTLAATNLSNIGIVYMVRKNFAGALNYYQQAYVKAKETGQENTLCVLLGNLGNISKDQGDSALAHGNRSLAFEDKYPKALEYYTEALKKAEGIQDKRNMASNLGDIGALFLQMAENLPPNQSAPKYKEAESYLLKSIAIIDSVGALDYKKDVEQGLSDLYLHTGRYQLAFEHYKKHISAKDTLFSAESAKKSTRTAMQYDFDKKEAVSTAEHKSEMDKQQAVAEEESRKQKIIIGSVALGLLFVLVFALFILRSWRITNKQKRVIEEQKKAVEHQKEMVVHQKEMVEEKNKEITDSITYAQRLQKAILPRRRDIHALFPDSFVLYIPKDIVAGDFYWMESSKGLTFIAAADSTGHGVPGAMVSVVCSNALNRAVKEFGLSEPGLILNKVRELVIETFEKSESEVKDGMDISLACINSNSGAVSWAGANNPLWYLQGGVMKELTADKQPIGRTDHPKPFTTHHIQLNKGDILYLFTDGLPDQFGGPKGKKFKYKAFQEILVSNASTSCSETKTRLEDAFHDWKGNLEQVDDICVIGIRINTLS